MTPQERDDRYHDLLFSKGSIQELEDFKSILVEEGDVLFACACQGRIEEIKKLSRNRMKKKITRLLISYILLFGTGFGLGYSGLEFGILMVISIVFLVLFYDKLSHVIADQLFKNKVN